MATPTTRATLKQYCLRRLGFPVIDINVDDDQVEDRIDDGLQYFAEYHFDGVEKVYLKHQLTAAEITQEYITVANPVVSILGVFPFSEGSSTNNMFNARYQIALNEFYNFSSVSMMDYVNVNQHLRLIEQILVGEQSIEYNRKTDKLYLPGMNWGSDVIEGNYLIIECWRALEPETSTQVYNDLFLKKYTTALIKRQWGSNLSKFEGVLLPGGVTMNGQAIYEAATTEIDKIEEEMQSRFELPVDFAIG